MKELNWECLSFVLNYGYIITYGSQEYLLQFGHVVLFVQYPSYFRQSHLHKCMEFYMNW